MSHKDLKGLKFCRVSDGRVFTPVVQDPHEVVPTILIESCLTLGLPPEHDIVFLSHHDDFISESGEDRYDLLDAN